MYGCVCVGGWVVGWVRGCACVCLCACVRVSLSIVANLGLNSLPLVMRRLFLDSLKPSQLNLATFLYFLLFF